MKANLLVLFTTLVMLCLLFSGIELIVRVSMPDVSSQDVDRHLVRPNVFGSTHGWVPNSSGFCFGKTARFDADGFRDVQHPDHTAVSWLLLGDSVCFGLGVDADSTFAALLQRALPTTRVWNTAAIGYDITSYSELLPFMLRKDPAIRHVLLFWCLNDIYAGSDGFQMHAIDSPLFALLRHHSRTYVVLKNLLADRSKAYFLHDAGLYRKGGLGKTVALLEAMNASLLAQGVSLTLVLLPYEYQLRTRATADLLPQQLVAETCNKLGVECVDLTPEFMARTGNTHAFYLFADGIHFSRRGHRVAFEALQRELRRSSLANQRVP